MLERPILRSSGSNYQPTIGNRLGESLLFLGSFQQVGSADRRAGFAKGNAVGIDEPQLASAKIRHRTRGGTNVKRISGADQHYNEMIEFGGTRQANILR